MLVCNVLEFIDRRDRSGRRPGSGFDGDSHGLARKRANRDAFAAAVLQFVAMIWLHRAQTYHPPLARAHQFRSFTINQRLQLPRFAQTLRNAYTPKNAVPSFREHVARTSPVKSFADSVKYPGVVKHIFVSEFIWSHVVVLTVSPVCFGRFSIGVWYCCTEHEFRHRHIHPLFPTSYAGFYCRVNPKVSKLC